MNLKYLKRSAAPTHIYIGSFIPTGFFLSFGAEHCKVLQERMREQRLTAPSVHLALQGIHQATSIYPRAWHRVGMKKAAEEQKKGLIPGLLTQDGSLLCASFMQGS